MTELAEPERIRYRADGRELQLFRWPRPGAPRLLLVHGIGMGHTVYADFISAITDNVEVIAVDLPGFGDTPEPDEARTMPETADLLAEALEDRRLTPVIAVGHSMGGQVVAELAARHPNDVPRAVLIASSVNPAERTVWKQAWRMIQDLSDGQPLSVFPRAAKTYMQAGPRWFAKKLREMMRHRVEETLPLIQQPTLVIRGEKDHVSPHEWALQMTSRLPHGELVEVPDRGHEALISTAEPIAHTILDWAGIAGPDLETQLSDV